MSPGSAPGWDGGRRRERPLQGAWHESTHENVREYQNHALESKTALRKTTLFCVRGISDSRENAGAQNHGCLMPR